MTFEDISIKQIFKKIHKLLQKESWAYVYHFGPKHIYRLQNFAGFEGSVSQGNVNIQFKGSHQTSEIPSKVNLPNKNIL